MQHENVSVGEDSFAFISTSDGRGWWVNGCSVYMWQCNHPVEEKRSDPRLYNRTSLCKLCVHAPRHLYIKHCRFLKRVFTPLNLMQSNTTASALNTTCEAWSVNLLFRPSLYFVLLLGWIALCCRGVAFIGSASCTATRAGRLRLDLAKSAFHKDMNKISQA